MALTGTQPKRPVSAFLSWNGVSADTAAQLRAQAGSDLAAAILASVFSENQLHFDAVLVEDHTRDCDVTEHPVEQGVNISDHVRPKVDELTLEVFVTNAPIYSNFNDAAPLPLTLDMPDKPLAPTLAALVAQGLQVIGQRDAQPAFASAITLQFPDGDVDFVQGAFDTLTTLRNTATLLQVVTPHQVYNNMVIERLTLHRDQATGDAGEFTIGLKQIRIVSSKIVDAPLPTVPRATPLADQGKKDAAQASGPKESALVNLARNQGVNLPAPAAGFPGVGTQSAN